MTSARWQSLSDWPLIGAAVLFLAAYSWQVLGDLHGVEWDLAELVMTLTWVLFTVDYVVRLVLAEHRLKWFGRHLLDLAVVALPILRPLRLIRLVTVLAIFQRVAGKTLRGKVVVYVAGSTVMLVYVASLAMLEAERPAPDAKIITFGDALWWACTTITTVGYGDLFPVTATGRCIAVGLMLGGIALIGTITASVAAWLVQKVAEEDGAEQSATRHQVNELTAQVRALQEMIVQQGRAGRGPDVLDGPGPDRTVGPHLNGNGHVMPGFEPAKIAEQRGAG